MQKTMFILLFTLFFIENSFSQTEDIVITITDEQANTESESKRSDLIALLGENLNISKQSCVEHRVDELLAENNNKILQLVYSLDPVEHSKMKSLVEENVALLPQVSKNLSRLMDNLAGTGGNQYIDSLAYLSSLNDTNFCCVLQQASNLEELDGLAELKDGGLIMILRTLGLGINNDKYNQLLEETTEKLKTVHRNKQKITKILASLISAKE